MDTISTVNIKAEVLNMLREFPCSAVMYDSIGKRDVDDVEAAARKCVADFIDGSSHPFGCGTAFTSSFRCSFVCNIEEEMEKYLGKDATDEDKSHFMTQVIATVAMVHGYYLSAWYRADEGIEVVF